MMAHRFAACLVAVLLGAGAAVAQDAQTPADDQSDVFEIQPPTNGEETGEQDRDANQTLIDPPQGEEEARRENASDVDIRSPFDPDFGERGEPDEADAANDTEPRGTPAVAIPVVLAALAALLVMARRRD